MGVREKAVDSFDWMLCTGFWLGLRSHGRNAEGQGHSEHHCYHYFRWLDGVRLTLFSVKLSFHAFRSTHSTLFSLGHL
jgi:hypothetical protein